MEGWVSEATASEPPRNVGFNPTLRDIARSREKHISLDNYLDLGQLHPSLQDLDPGLTDHRPLYYSIPDKWNYS